MKQTGLPCSSHFSRNTHLPHKIFRPVGTEDLGTSLYTCMSRRLESSSAMLACQERASGELRASERVAGSVGQLVSIKGDARDAAKASLNKEISFSLAKGRLAMVASRFTTGAGGMEKVGWGSWSWSRSSREAQRRLSQAASRRFWRFRAACLDSATAVSVQEVNLMPSSSARQWEGLGDREECHGPVSCGGGGAG